MTIFKAKEKKDQLCRIWRKNVVGSGEKRRETLFALLVLVLVPSTLVPKVSFVPTCPSMSALKTKNTI